MFKSLLTKVTMTVLTLLVMCSSAMAIEIKRTDAETLLLRMQSVLNRKSTYEMTRFFKFYSDDTARFLMKNHLVNPNDTNETLATEELNMTWEQYVSYLENIMEPNYKYIFKIKMTDFNFNEDAELGNVSFSIQEYALQRQYDKNGIRTDEDITTLGATNCNLTVGANATDLEILSMNCISKIVRK